MEMVSSVADIIQIVGAVFTVLFAVLGWREARQANAHTKRRESVQNERIKVFLSNGTKQTELPVALRRAEVTRAEVLGRLGMLPIKEKGARFALGYLNKSAFLEDINSIAVAEDQHDTRLMRLIIHCSDSEFNQFDLK